MAKQTLTIEYDYDFLLVGISCHEKYYRLCWALNLYLQLDLARTKDLVIERKKPAPSSNYVLCFFDDAVHYRQYYLISNKSDDVCLLPEHKQVDFFLMVKGSVLDKDKPALIQAIRETQTVLTAFEIDASQLKSRENLLF